MRPLRVIDTGIRGGRENVAFDQALIEARNVGRVPETLRFLRFRPCALGSKINPAAKWGRLAWAVLPGA